jgi:transposase
VKRTRTAARQQPKQDKRQQSYTVEDIWQELQQVRERVSDLESDNEKLRKDRWATEEYLRKQIRKLEKDVFDRDAKIEKLNKQLAWLRKERFGEKTEKHKAEPSEATEEPDESDKTPGRTRGQQRGSRGHGRTDRSAIPVSEIVSLKIPGGCKCPDCGTPYLELATTADSLLTEIQLMLFNVMYLRFKYVSQCKCHGKRIIGGPAAPRLYPRTPLGNSLWVHLLVQKFLQSTPTSRTLKELSLYGFSLSEGTVTGGFKMIDGLLDKVHNEIVRHCQGGDLWNADETTWRVFNANKTKWWMWLIASDDAVVYMLDPSRSSRVPTAFFEGSAGTLMTDRFSAYKSLQEAIKKAWCWVHVRRDFLNVFLGVPALKKWAQDWLKEIALLFVLSHKRFRLFEQNKTLGIVWDQAEAAVRQQVEKLKWRWQTELKRKNLHAEQRTILRSLKRHWGGLTLFIDDPRIPLHNNRAERLLRQAVILRKNSFGSGSEWAGGLAAKLFSIFQTWLINGLDPQALLLNYFDECAKTPGRAPPTVNDFLPWTMSEERKQAFALPETYKRPG